MQLSSKPSLKTALSEWRKLLFAQFLRLIVYFANQHFSQEWSIFEGNQHFWKRRQNSNDCDVIRLNRVNPNLWRTILASEDASEKTFLTNTSKSCWKKNPASEKKMWIRRIVKALPISKGQSYFWHPYHRRKFANWLQKKSPLHEEFRHKWKKTPNLAWFRNF